VNKLCQLQTGTSQDAETVFRESCQIWGGGLSLDAYLASWREVEATAWGKAHLQFLTWKNDAGTVFSSLKAYRPVLHLEGQAERTLVLGAIYTPVRFRGQGHGARMIRAILDRATREGVRFALLFTDIGTGYYRQFGFCELPAFNVTAGPGRAELPSGNQIDLVPFEARYEEEVQSAHQAGMAVYTLRIERDPSHWEFLQTRTRGFFSRIRGRSYDYRFRVALRNGRFLGYLVSVEDHSELDIREIGARGGSVASMAEILRSVAEERGPVGSGLVYGWLPDRLVQATPEWNWKKEKRSLAVPMIASLSHPEDSDDLALRVNSFFPYTDQF
jgi:GNAT superfamily N-acetyltransferase